MSSLADEAQSFTNSIPFLVRSYNSLSYSRRNTHRICQYKQVLMDHTALYLPVSDKIHLLFWENGVIQFNSLIPKFPNLTRK